MRATPPPPPGTPSSTTTAIAVTVVLSMAFTAVAVAALVIVLTESRRPATGVPAAAAISAAPPPSSAPPTGEPTGETRLAPGTPNPLTLTEETRAHLATAAFAAPNEPNHQRAAEVARVGTLHYGKIFGATPQEDLYYAVAPLDLAYFWTSRGPDAWRYLGAYPMDACMPQIPEALGTAWGTGQLGQPCNPADVRPS